MKINILKEGGGGVGGLLGEGWYFLGTDAWNTKWLKRLSKPYQSPLCDMKSKITFTPN